MAPVADVELSTPLIHQRQPLGPRRLCGLTLHRAGTFMAETKNEKTDQRKPLPERLGISLNSWSGVVVATTVLIGALVGLYIGVVNGWHAIHPTSSPTTSRGFSTTPPGQGGSGTRGSASSGQATMSAGGKSGALIDSGTIRILNGDNLSYQTGAGNEVVFIYYASLGYLDAGSNVNLALLDAPAPASSAAYQACEGISSSSYTQQIPLNTIAAGDTLCAFTPNNEVTWVQFLGTQGGQSAFSETLDVSAITWQGPSS
jgi:hypothetical protein